MKHRHLDTHEWNKAAIFSLVERGTWDDWIEFAKALNEKPNLEIDFVQIARSTKHETFAQFFIEQAKKKCEEK